MSLSGLFLLALNKLLHCVPLSLDIRLNEKLEMERGWFAEENALGRSSMAPSYDFQQVQCYHQVTVAFALMRGMNDHLQRLDFNSLCGLSLS